MIRWLKSLQNKIKNESPLVIVTVVKTRGSTPCANGSKMIITYDRASTNQDNFSLWGSVGGGLIEQKASEYAKKLWWKYHHQDSDYQLYLQTYQVHAESGQCCGGEVSMSFEYLMTNDTHLKWISALISYYYQGIQVYLCRYCLTDEMSHIGIYTEITTMQSDINQVLSHFSNNTQNTLKTLPHKALNQLHRSSNFMTYTENENFTLVIETLRFDQILSVCLYGCGHISRALVPMIAELPIKIYWIDDRQEEFALCEPSFSQVPDNVFIHCQDYLSIEIPQKAYCLVMTYSHQMDYAICKQILSSAHPSYLGLIGSQQKSKRFLRFLQQESTISPKILQQYLHCPIGKPYHTQKSPTAVAISIANHLLQTLDEREQAIITT